LCTYESVCVLNSNSWCALLFYSFLSTVRLSFTIRTNFLVCFFCSMFFIVNRVTQLHCIFCKCQLRVHSIDNLASMYILFLVSSTVLIIYGIMIPRKRIKWTLTHCSPRYVFSVSFTVYGVGILYTSAPAIHTTSILQQSTEWCLFKIIKSTSKHTFFKRTYLWSIDEIDNDGQSYRRRGYLFGMW
jgi:hypothetical protein